MDAVLFRSDAFSLEPGVARGRTYDTPLGVDLAGLLRQRMLEARPGLEIDTPIPEDWGTVLWVKDGTHEYHLNIHWMAGGRVENRWGIQFSRRLGVLRALFGKPSSPQECRTMQALVRAVLAAEPETFRDVEWLSQGEYEVRM